MSVLVAAFGGAVAVFVWVVFRRAASAAGELGAVADALPTAVPLRPDAIVCRTLRVYFIKPSKYDDAGWVQWFWKGVLPNNTLTVLAALNDTYNQLRRDQGVYLETVIWDEQVDGPILPATIRAIQEKALEDGVEVVVGLAGVQTNQYPRGRDLAFQFRRAGFPVLFGGFHVSGHPETRVFLEDCGITTVVGEAETIWCELLDDYLRGELRPSYSVTDGIRAKTGSGEITVPVITGAQLPAISDPYLHRFASSNMTTLDTSRGCPFTCSYCSVKNVMGRTMRARDPEAVVRWIRDAGDHHGIRSLFIVDDDFFRSPTWEPILEGMAAYRRDGHELTFMMQVDAEAAAFGALGPGESPSSQRRKCERFLELSAAAGCYSAFVGFETFNPQNLLATTKVQNLEKEHRRRKDEAADGALAAVKEKYRRVVHNWHRHGVAVHCGYMIGFPFDGPECGRQSAEWLLEVGVDLASFFVVTPLPGTEDHDRAVRDGTILDWDFNNYDSQHMVSHHPRMTTAEVVQAYRDAYLTFYSGRNTLRSLLTLHRVPGLGREARSAMWRQRAYYYYSYRAGRHPMLGGIWQRRLPGARREVLTDEEARGHYLGGGIVSAEGVRLGMPAGA
ncbi:MAG: radical SAM protein [Deltaproteobacteria bacterium]|nr:MAG: radical SAM protein [Deltaproteobacteria bacterium]